MLGKLKEEDHDDDELYYLESLCHYHSGDFKQAVKYAKKVKKNAIDYPKAHSILLESLAYLGEAEEFTTVLSEIKKEQIDYYSLIALVQKLTMNIPIKTDFSAHFDKIEHYIQGFKQQQIQSNQIQYMLYETLSIASAYLEFVGHKLLLQQSMSDQQVGEIAQQEETATYENRLIRALQWNPYFDEFFGVYNETKSSSRMLMTIFKKLGNTTVEHMLVLLHAISKVDSKEFLQQMMLNYAVFETLLKKNYLEKEIIRLIEIAYIQSVLLKSEHLKALEKILTQFGHFTETKLSIEQQVQEHSWNNFLSKMTQFGWYNAERDYEPYKDAENVWQDSSMLSLAYYRLLEMEANEQIIKPVLTEQLLFKAKQFVNGIDMSEATKSIWNRLIQQLQSIYRGEKDGLDAGTLNIFLGKLKKVDKEDAQLKQLFQEAIIAPLNEEGVKAIENGSLANFFAFKNRDRFRNPPAHTRFIPLMIAKECRTFVKEALIIMGTIKNN